ncbi:hypothetical protein HMPREF0663_10751 [Hoylesella oralis ATCC 33269]|uniref:DUF4827 domain-containing protein n=1 Tax=Hoylesella oralis ATCC 33269 TaxID=873533 RepID=E7RNK0_9BACT|nr:DUF4827 domain-containing protein [Hoylesella oralis]EFZ37293.1 hypothetical protein HMPREF0663_10751 [Hoylesella oralis ATCC 33269]EPH14878.1 hypothetical protein HMPREF1475_02271 [Hoylesella oralis HGA0225]SHG07051.1 protein of unknown function [Hoylesella oralis]
MRKLSYLVLFTAGLLLIASCSHRETYADQKKREREAISRYITKHNINIISEAQFEAAGFKTDTAKNQYVLFTSSGVYMQIINEGCGNKLNSGETATALCRFTERNLLTDTIQLSNNILRFSSIVDKMTVKNTSGTFTASFLKGSSLMYTAYNSASVPTGWLVPLTYVKLGRPVTATDQIAKVKLIVPHTSGQRYATQGVYPCSYELTYERGL